MKKRERIVPVFLPRAGCPQKCSFCAPSVTIGPVLSVEQQVAEALRIAADGCIIAFYGGSFTHLPIEQQDELLDGIAPAVAQGRVRSVRISARPDGERSFKDLVAKAVGSVEFGVPSLSDKVLEAAGRSHNAACVVDAVSKAREAGLEIGLQLMIGLPEEAPEDREETLRKVIRIKPDFVRLSPTLVLKGSSLEDLYRNGSYVPLPLERAVEILAHYYMELTAHGISVIRIGLYPTPQFKQGIVAGPWLPRLGELVRERAMRLATTEVA